MRTIDAKAMLVWLICALVIPFVFNNPAVDLVVIGAALAVASIGEAGSSFKGFLKIGVAAAVFRTILFALTGHDGHTVMFALPKVSLIGLEVGGNVYAEVVAYSIAEGLRIVSVLACFGAFLSVTPTIDILRLVPNVFFDAGLVVNIALAFAPQISRTAREVREAQQLRGLPAKSRRSVGPVLLPVLATALEKSVALAESMDVRGYGGAGAPASRRSRTALGFALTAAVLGTMLLIMGAVRPLTASIAAVGSVASAVMLHSMSKRSGRSRYRTHRFAPNAIATCIASIAALGFSFAIGLTTSMSRWDPYEDLRVPDFAPWLLVVAFLVAVPALLPLESRRKKTEVDQ